MKNITKSRLKASLRASETYLDENHLKKVMAGANDEFSKKERRNRTNFTTFLVRQIKFTAWKIWMFQGIILIALCMVLSSAFGDLFLGRAQHVVILLCGSAILIMMTAVPFIERGIRYNMHEIEAATKFSSLRLLATKLMIIGIGDSIMLSSILLLAFIKTTINIGTVALYLMLPFLMVTSVCLYVLGHFPAHRFSFCCGGIGMVVFIMVSGLCYLYPEITKQTFSVSWGLICMALTIFCVYQLRYIMRCSSYAEIKLA